MRLKLFNHRNSDAPLPDGRSAQYARPSQQYDPNCCSWLPPVRRAVRGISEYRRAPACR